MNIDWTHFTPVQSLCGGALIGLASAILLIANGKIAGISGIFGQALLANRVGRWWRLAFLAGLLLAPWVLNQARPLQLETVPLGRLVYLFVAGSLTGYGTYLARGCTSGHGICGLSRLSLRSFVAVALFMGSGIVTVTLLRHLTGVVS